MNRTRAAFAIVLSLALLLGSAAPASAVTASDLAAHQQAAEAARQQAAAAAALANQLKSETVQLDEQVDALQADADALNPEIEEVTSRTEKLEAEVDRLRQEVDAKTAQIAETQAEYQEQQRLLGERVNAAYRQGNWFYLDIILGSSNVADLIARTEFVSRVMRSNAGAAENLASTKTSLETAKAQLDATLADMSMKRDEARTLQAKLEKLKAQRQQKVDAQQVLLNQKGALLAETQANAARLAAVAQAEEAESAKIASQLASRSGSGQYNGTMAWPVPGFYNVTSPYGYRMHPILGVNKLHTGIDIGRNGSQSIAGAAIVAAGSGKVITASYLSGYGNTVMIDHGNGVVTLYAHQPNGGIKVSVGQTVTRGQRIGTVGSTGYSTGPHLHFEVRINGTPVDPMKYLK